MHVPCELVVPGTCPDERAKSWRIGKLSGLMRLLRSQAHSYILDVRRRRHGKPKRVYCKKEKKTLSSVMDDRAASRAKLKVPKCHYEWFQTSNVDSKLLKQITNSWHISTLLSCRRREMMIVTYKIRKIQDSPNFSMCIHTRRLFR